MKKFLKFFQHGEILSFGAFFPYVLTLNCVKYIHRDSKFGNWIRILKVGLNKDPVKIWIHNSACVTQAEAKKLVMGRQQCSELFSGPGGPVLQDVGEVPTRREAVPHHLLVQYCTHCTTTTGHMKTTSSSRRQNKNFCTTHVYCT